jgi:trehalose 6-phosphate synthase
VDRLDYSKGLIERFNSYQALLNTTPDLQGNITFVQIAPLSRINVAAYADIRDALEQWETGRDSDEIADLYELDDADSSGVYLCRADLVDRAVW